MMQLQAFDRNELSAIPSQHSGGEYLSRGYYRRLMRDLRNLGAVSYDLMLPETHSLPLIMQQNEQINGIVYGRYKQERGTPVGRGALAATDRRVLLIDRKPLFVRCEEISYDVVSAVAYSRVGPIGTVTLQTRMGTITLRTFNQQCAHSFVTAIETHIFTPQAGRRRELAQA